MPEINIAFFDTDMDICAAIKSSSGILFLTDFSPNTINVLRKLVQGDGASNIPTAVVLTKPERPLENYTHKTFFNLREFYEINDAVESFILEVAPNFRNALRRHFAELGFFAALDGQRADEPLLWLLYRLGCIEGYENQ
jgi:hypothetical protein